jgi:hypothetical protein
MSHLSEFSARITARITLTVALFAAMALIYALTPTPLIAPYIIPQDDTGISNSDGITSLTNPIIEGVCTDTNTVNIYVDGSMAATAPCSGGMFSTNVSLAE